MAAQRGFGTVDLNQIDFLSEVKGPLADFDSRETDGPDTVASWRRTTCEQGLVYLDRMKELVDRYRGEFIYLQDGQVVWHGPDPSNMGSRRLLSGLKKDSGMWLKLADPDEVEGERFTVYEDCLAHIAA